MTPRVTLDAKGHLDEVVSDGGAHLERMSRSSWFLSFINADGSEFAVWFSGKITMTEHRPAPTPPVQS